VLTDPNGREYWPLVTKREGLWLVIDHEGEEAGALNNMEKVEAHFNLSHKIQSLLPLFADEEQQLPNAAHGQKKARRSANVA
jgi:hypothetical protein